MPPCHLTVSTLLLSALICAAIISCTHTSEDPRPDVSALPVDVEIRRFEQDLFTLDTLHLDREVARIDSSYGEFANLFFDRILGASDTRIAPNGRTSHIGGFITHPSIRGLYDTIQIAYPDLQREKPHFTRAFQLLQHWFPDRPTPRITTFLSEFSIANFIFGDDELAIGLDLYLGRAYPYTTVDPTNPVFSEYLVRTYNRDHLVPRTIQPLVEDLVGPPTGDRLIDHIIRNGKVLYLLEYLLPEIPDTARTAYTPAQLQWCQENERNIWQYFLSEELLYSTDWKTFRKYVEYSPHSPGMPTEAPGRTGDWIGLQIVRAWLRQQPAIDIPALLQTDDAQQFLEQARYKPPR